VVRGTRPSRSGGPCHRSGPLKGLAAATVITTNGNRNTENGDASDAVAGPADVANHGVGGCGDAAVSTTIPELHSEQGALPDRRGGIVSAGG